jgi:uncharacterized protein with NRDE domain
MSPANVLGAPRSVAVVCTVVLRWEPGTAARLLAIRDEFVSRDFDPPGQWWPSAPGVVGGRDQRAGGSWCVTRVDSGTTALVLNRRERQTGTPSRGVLPLAAVADGADWPERVPYRGMASFNLVVARPDEATVWSWDTTRLDRIDLEPGLHLVTSSGVDTDDPKTRAFAPRFAAADDWLDVLAATEPSDEIGALVVRHQTENDVYATVFGQLISAAPGALTVLHTRTPWRRDSWVESRF